MSVLVGRKAPAINAKAVVNGGEFVDNFSLDQYLGKKRKKRRQQNKKRIPNKGRLSGRRRR